MQVFKCDRCGRIVHPDNKYDLVAYSHNFEKALDYDLCENCYQTIKEVLEDGEIK